MASFNIKQEGDFKSKLIRASDNVINTAHSVASSPRQLSKLKTIELSNIDRKVIPNINLLKPCSPFKKIRSPAPVSAKQSEPRMIINAFSMQYISEINAKDIGLGKEPTMSKKMQN